MKKFLFLYTMVLIFALVSITNAALTTIGTASYLGSDYNLIYEDDSIYGGLAWLDYSNAPDNWYNQVSWASELGGSLTVSLDPLYTTDIDWSIGWRLPSADEDPQKGDIQSLPTLPFTSEMGHLYYESLGKPNDGPLGDTDPFENLQAAGYWSGTDYPLDTDFDVIFWFDAGYQGYFRKTSDTPYAMAVRPAEVSVVPVPSALWLLGSGLIGIVGIRRKFKN